MFACVCVCVFAFVLGVLRAHTPYLWIIYRYENSTTNRAEGTEIATADSKVCHRVWQLFKLISEKVMVARKTGWTHRNWPRCMNWNSHWAVHNLMLIGSCIYTLQKLKIMKIMIEVDCCFRPVWINNIKGYINEALQFLMYIPRHLNVYIYKNIYSFSGPFNPMVAIEAIYHYRINQKLNSDGKLKLD